MFKCFWNLIRKCKLNLKKPFHIQDSPDIHQIQVAPFVSNPTSKAASNRSTAPFMWLLTKHSSKRISFPLTFLQIQLLSCTNHNNTNKSQDSARLLLSLLSTLSLQNGDTSQQHQQTRTGHSVGPVLCLVWAYVKHFDTFALGLTHSHRNPPFR